MFFKNKHFVGFPPACSLRLYGSCLTRFAFKTSDVNIDVAYPATVSYYMMSGRPRSQSNIRRR